MPDTDTTTTQADQVTGKTCNGCDTWKPLDDFQRDAKGKHGRRARCKACGKSPTATPAATPEPVAAPEPEPAAPAPVAEGKKPARTAFYLTVITKPMTATQVAAALQDAGWPDEGMPKVVATLGYLVRRQAKLTVSLDDVPVYAPVAAREA